MDSFTELALRALAGDLTAEERRALEAETSAHPERREEFEQLKAMSAILSTTLPMTEAIYAQEPELPAYRLNELKTAVRQHFGPTKHRTTASTGGFSAFSRWLLAGGGLTAMAIVVVFLSFSNRSVEVGLYRTNQVRGDSATIAATDVPSARLVMFDQDAPFDRWQNAPLGWWEKAKVWIDNEHDVLHITRRDAQGNSVSEAQPLAPTDEGQREQIKQVVETLR